MRLFVFSLLLCVAAAQSVTSPANAAQQSDPSKKIRIEGTVASLKGEPVRQPTLRLEAIGTTNAQLPTTYSTTGDAAGKFAFQDVPAGRYTLTASKAGFVTQKYGARSATSPGTTLTLDAGQGMQDLNIKLTPQGVISGKVMDEDGDPVRGVRVATLRVAFDRNGRKLQEGGGGQTTDQGEFKIQGLAPGRYYLLAEPVGEIAGLAPGHLMTYYPNGLDSASAVAVEVAAGAELQSIDIRLRREKLYSLKGKAIDISTGGPAAGLMMDWIYKGARSEPQDRQIWRARDDGSFMIRNLLPGSYVLDTLQGGSVSGGPAMTLGLSGRLEFTVTDSNVEDVVFPVGPGATVSGTFRLEDGGDLQKVLQPGMRPAITLVPLDGPYAVPNRMKDDGTFVMDKVSVGAYLLDVAALPQGTYMKTVRYGVRDVTHSALDLSAGSSTIDILLSQKAADVIGVVRSEKGESLPGMTVSVWPKTPDRGNSVGGARTAVTDQNGSFKIGNLPPDEYYVLAWEDIDPNLALLPDFLSRFSGDASTVKLSDSAHETANVKLIANDKIAAEVTKLPPPAAPRIGTSGSGRTTSAAPRATAPPMEGHVLDWKGNPVRKATVRISGPPSFFGPTLAITDEKGAYTFDDVPPGIYELSAEKSGFLTQRLGANSPGISRDTPAAKLSLKAGQQLTGLDFKLVPQAVITGRVTNPAGEPLANAIVTTVNFQYVRGRRQLGSLQGSATSDAQGNYRITNAAPGTYYLSTLVGGGVFEALSGNGGARSGPDSPMRTFYPSTTDIANAVALEVTPGSELHGMDIQVHTARTYTVKGVVTAPAGSGPLSEQFLSLRPKDRNDPLRSNASARPNAADGSFEFRSVFPGTYLLQAGLTRLGNSFASPTLFGQQEITVTDADVEGLSIALMPGFRVTGTVSVEGGDSHPRPGLRIEEPPDSTSSFWEQSSYKDDGTFELKSVAPAKYLIQLNSVPPGLYVKSIRVGGQDGIHEPIDLTGGPKGSLEIVLSSKIGEVAGTVKNEAGDSAGSVLVTMWPKTPEAGTYTAGVRSVSTDLKGGFLLSDVAPGEYYVAAWAQIEPGLAQATEFLARFNGTASEIKVDDSGRANANLTLISTEKIAAELAKLP